MSQTITNLSAATEKLIENAKDHLEGHGLDDWEISEVHLRHKSDNEPKVVCKIVNRNGKQIPECF
jgi:hypothetical protein